MNLLLALLSPIFVYVANQASGKVTVIDAATDSVVAIVDFTALGFSAHPKPHHIVVEPDGSYWYVSLVGDNAFFFLMRRQPARSTLLPYTTLSLWLTTE